MDWLSAKMKRKYCHKGFKSENHPWLPITTESYISLALVYQKDYKTEQINKELIRLFTQGDIHKIPQAANAKKLTSLVQIFDPAADLDGVPNSILIEGHVGIGKTTLVKEICIKWTKGELLTSDKLVLLLLLRDPKAKNITNVQKLIEYFTDFLAVELHQEFNMNHGAGITLIIDGFDELSTELRNDSFFRELIEKKHLPGARLVVTSRPSASACQYFFGIDKRIEILGFEQSSKEQYVTEAFQNSPSKLVKLQKHLKLYPNIDAICYVPLVMAIIVFLCHCQPDHQELPLTATTMFTDFILHIVCHYLKQKGLISEDEAIDKLKNLPPMIYTALQKLEKVAFDGLEKDRIVFTDKELHNVCKGDSTCYGLLQVTKFHSARGTLTHSFNFPHLGIQEYFAAKYVTTLSENEVDTLLRDSFIVTESGVDDRKSVRLSNMWILYCGITSGQSKALRDYLTTYGKSSDVSTLSIQSHSTIKRVDGKTVSSSERKTLSLGKISPQILNNPVKILYLFQCFQEAQDNKLCEEFSGLFDSGVINISNHILLPHQVRSLRLFLLSSQRKWEELNLSACHIKDNGMCILHQLLCGDKDHKLKITKIILSNNNLSGASSHHIADIITYLQPHTVELNCNTITNVKDISDAITASQISCKELNMEYNCLAAQEVEAISNMMTCLKKLNISNNKLGDNGAELLSKGITDTKTLQVLNIVNNNIKSSGTTAIAKALTHNISIIELHMEDNKVGQDGSKAIAKAITTNNVLKSLSLDDNSIDTESMVTIIRSLHDNNTIIEICFPYTQLYYDYSIKEEVIKININRNKHHVQDFELKHY